MKNKVWVAISFSMLAAAAATVPVAQAKKPDQAPSAPGAEALVKALKIGQVPVFEKSVPCYLTGGAR